MMAYNMETSGSFSNEVVVEQIPTSEIRNHSKRAGIGKDMESKGVEYYKERAIEKSQK